jgi:hypothetical protein
MVAVEFPKPTGHPVLLVTSKQAFVLHPHIQDKVILSVKVPKQGSVCSSTSVTKNEGPWTLVLNGTTVYCYYANSHVRGTWYAELTPKGSEEFTETALNTGLRPNDSAMVHTAFMMMALTFLILSIAIVGFHTLGEVQKKLFGTTNKRFDSLFVLVNNPTDVGGPPGLPACAPDLMGPPGACDPVGGHITTVNGVGEITDHPPKPLKDDDPIVTDDTFEPGSELKEGEQIRLGENVIRFRRCRFNVEKAEQQRTFLNGASDSEGCTLTMQRDGNMVMYHPEKGAVWSSRELLKGQMCPKGITLTKKGKLACQTKVARFCL